MTSLADVPTTLSDADLVAWTPLDVVTVEDMRPSAIVTLLLLPFRLISLPFRAVGYVLRRPWLLLLILVAGFVIFWFSPLRQQLLGGDSDGPEEPAVG